MTTAKPSAVASYPTLPYRLVLDINALDMTEDQFFKLCADNGDLRMELTAKRELIIMPPVGLESGSAELELAMQLGIWAREDGSGRAFGPSAGYTLPNGAVRAPDASWMPLLRWESLSRAEQTSFGHTFPDFVIELRSPSDTLRTVQDKMVEYMDNGVRLGWLIDPQDKRVHIYRPGQPVETLEGPDTVSGAPVLPGFVLEMQRIWGTGP